MTEEKQLRLMQAVVIVEAALEEKYDQWKKQESSKKNQEVLKTMENTHKMVLDYIYGMLKEDLKIRKGAKDG